MGTSVGRSFPVTSPFLFMHLKRFFLVLLALAGLGSTHAAEIVVTNTNDSGAGSLRQALLDAGASAGADTIVFSDGSGGTVNFQDASPETITLASPLPVNSDVTIQGPGANRVKINGADANRVLEVSGPGGAL